jgi:hypothetical protein
MANEMFDGGSRFPDLDDYDAFARVAKRAPKRGIQRDASGQPFAARLPVTASAVNLASNNTMLTPQFPADFTMLIDTQAELSWPRTISVYSPVILPPGVNPIGFSTAPFQVRIQWFAGGGRGGEIFITGSGGGLQFSVNCKSVRIDVGNWVNFPNPVNVSIQNALIGQSQELHYIDRSQIALAAGANLQFGIPPFARKVEVRPSNQAQAGNMVVSIQDNAFTTMTQQLASDGDIDVNCGVFVDILNNDPAPLAVYVLDYTLGFA